MEFYFIFLRELYEMILWTTPCGHSWQACTVKRTANLCVWVYLWVCTSVCICPWWYDTVEVRGVDISGPFFLYNESSSQRGCSFPSLSSGGLPMCCLPELLWDPARSEPSRQPQPQPVPQPKAQVTAWTNPASKFQSWNTYVSAEAQPTLEF